MDMNAVKRKVFIFISMAALVAILVIGGYFSWRLIVVRQYSDTLETQLEEAYAAEGESPWLAQEESKLTHLTADATSDYDQTFQILANNVSMAASFMSRVLANPENFTGKTMPKPSGGEEGVFSAKSIVVKEGDEKNAENINNLRIISNIDYAFSSAVETNHDISSIYYTSESGLSAVYTDTNAYADYLDLRETDWYKNAVASPDLVTWVGPAAGSDDTKTMVITAALTAQKPDGSTAGVVAGNLTLATLIQPVSSLEVGTEGKAFLLDAKGNLIGAEGIGASILEGAEGEYLAALESMVAGEQGSAVVDIDGKQKIFSYAPLSNGFSLGIYRDVEELKVTADGDASALTQAVAVVSSEVKALVQNSFIIGGIVALVVLLLIVLLAFFIAKSIGKMDAPVTVTPAKSTPPVQTKVKKKKGREAALEAIALAEAEEIARKARVKQPLSYVEEPTESGEAITNKEGAKAEISAEDEDMRIVPSAGQTPVLDAIEEAPDDFKGVKEDGIGPNLQIDAAQDMPEQKEISAESGNSTLFLRRKAGEPNAEEGKGTESE